MKKSKKEVNNIDKYIANFPKKIKDKLYLIRKTIKKAAPKAKETIKYRIPTFTLNGNLVHFAAYKKHIGFYPTSSPIVIFKKELSQYKTSKGAIQFPIDKPIPYSLITKIVKFRIKEAKKKIKRK